MTTLFQIGADFAALEQLLSEVDETNTESLNSLLEAQQMFDRWASELDTDQSIKVDAYRAMIRKWESELAVAKAMKEQYQREEKSREGKIRWLKDRMKAYMEFRGLKKIVTDTLGEVRIQTNGGKLPILPEGWADGIDPKTIEPRFTRPSVNTEAVRSALEGGEELPFAKLGERGSHVRVK